MNAMKLKEVIKNSEVYDLNITSTDRKFIKEVDDWLFKSLPRNSTYSIKYSYDNRIIYAETKIFIRSREFTASSEGAKMEDVTKNMILEIKKDLSL